MPMASESKKGAPQIGIANGQSTNDFLGADEDELDAQQLLANLCSSDGKYLFLNIFYFIE
jgi:hypothetical protein